MSIPSSSSPRIAVCRDGGFRNEKDDLCVAIGKKSVEVSEASSSSSTLLLQSSPASSSASKSWMRLKLFCLVSAWRLAATGS